MFTSILSAIAAIPALLKAVQELLGWFKKAQEERWFAEKTEAMQAIRDAKTDEDFKNAAKKLADTLRGL